MSAQESTRPTYRVRNARRGDAEAIRSLVAELGYPDAADSQTVAWVISHPEMEIFVAADSQDKPVGFLSLSHRPQLRLRGRIGTIDELIVTRTWQRKGVGRALIQKALERLKVLSVQRLELNTSIARGPAVLDFYLACGFVKVESHVLRLAALERRP